MCPLQKCRKKQPRPLCMVPAKHAPLHMKCTWPCSSAQVLLTLERWNTSTGRLMLPRVTQPTRPSQAGADSGQDLKYHSSRYDPPLLPQALSLGSSVVHIENPGDLIPIPHSAGQFRFTWQCLEHALVLDLHSQVKVGAVTRGYCLVGPTWHEADDR
jgi:hypothetical protein